MQIYEVFSEAVLKGAKPAAATPVSIGGQPIPPTDPLYQKIMQSPGAQTTTAPPPKTKTAKSTKSTAGSAAFGQMAQQLAPVPRVPAKARDAKGRFVGKGSQVFGQMAQQLAPNAPAAPAVDAGTWAGQNVNVPAYQRKQAAQATTAQQPAAQQPAAQQPTAQQPTAQQPTAQKAGVKWRGVGSALAGHAIAGLGNAIRRNAPYGHYDVDDIATRAKSSRVDAKSAGLTPQQIALIKQTGDPKLDKYLKSLGFFGPQQGAE